MLRISPAKTADDTGQMVLRLEGQVRGPWVEELRRVCYEAVRSNRYRRNTLVLDLADVVFVDIGGIALFRHLTAHDVLLTNCSPFVAEQLKGVADGER